MTPDWMRVKGLFHEALARPAEGRDAYLQNACAGDGDLRAEVERLLAAHAEAGSFIDRAPLPLSLIGRTISHYRIVEPLGGGGMGVVYRAEDLTLRRQVALKFLAPELTRDDEARRRLVAEAQAASALDHPNICTIYEIDQTPDGQIFLAMAYCAGETLKQKIARGPVPLDEALDIAIQLARGLARAHASGIVHRDIKPANVLVTPDGIVKIVDFGLAKLQGQPGLTRAGGALGTPAYMSPEQAEGRPVDARADVFSAGLVLYEMVAGRPAFAGDTVMGVLRAVVATDPPALRGSPRVASIDRIVRRAIAKRVEERYQTASALSDDLRAAARPAGAAASLQAEQRIAPVALEGERKRATVLHAAIANAAELAEGLQSSELHELTGGVLDVAADEVGKYEGVLTVRHADGFVAVFGAAIVHEDDARRALMAALGIRDRLAGARQEPAADRVDIRAGIDTGPLVINRVAGDRRVEYHAMGDTMRAADALLQFAGPGDIVIGEATRRGVEKHVRVEPIASVPGLRAYRVVAVVHGAPEAPRPGRAFAAFIGRGREVRQLEGLLAQALAGRGQVVMIAGEPGIGKSRLLYELTRTLAERPLSPTVLEGRCVSYGSLAPYLPLTDLVRALCGIDEADPPEAARSAIDRAAAEAGLHAEAGLWLHRLIGIADDAAMVAAPSPEAMKARTFEAMRLLFLKSAVRRPLAIAVEDVHWIDRTSEEFLATLVERMAGARILLVATHRHGYRAPWMDRSYVTQITLAALDDAESARLVDSVAGERLGADVSAAILNRGEGNPFFLEELARAAVEHGPAVETIPGTVQGVIMARLDRLPESAKRLLQTAAIVGREVPLRLLTRVWEGNPDIEAELSELCRLEFLYERSGGDDAIFVFKHALTQDVAYDSLLAHRRRVLHLRAARALEELYADRLDEMAATLAYQYARTDVVDEAVAWLMRAADRAARVYANAEALLHLDLAGRRVQRLPEGPDRDRRTLDVALRHAHSLYFLGRFRESVDVLAPHEARLTRLGDPALTASYAFWLAHMYSRLGDQKRAAESAERAIEAAARAGDEATLGKAHGLLALEGHWAGRPGDGIAHGMTAVRLLAPRTDQRWWLGMAHFYLALNRLLQGDFDAALDDCGRANEVGKEIGDPRLQAYAAFTVGWIQASRGNLDEGAAACRRGIELAPDRVSRAYASLMLAMALVEQRNPVDARALLEPVAAELEGFGFPQWHALAITLTAETYRLQGRLEEAVAFARRGLQVAAGARYWYAIGLAQRVAGRIARDRGDVAEAGRALEQAAATFEQIGATFEAARTNRELAGG